MKGQALLFATGPFRAFEIGAEDIPMLQRFYETNPEYHVAVNGKAPGPDAAREDFESALPANWPYEKIWLLGFRDGAGSMIGMASVVSNLFAPGIWHIGLFIVATVLHGRGTAQTLYGRLESWMRENGAR